MDANKQYLSTKIDPILEPLVTQILLEKPNDPVDFILNWLEKLKKPSMKIEPKKPIQEEHKSEPENESDSENESSEDEEAEKVHQLRVAALSKAPVVARRSVSAEAYGEWNKRAGFVPRVIPKTAEQKERIRSKLENSFIFGALTSKELEIIVDAMEEKKYQEGHMVIRQGDEGDNLYVVELGALVCVRQVQRNAPPKFIKEYVPGEAFGELALLYNAPRAATITTKVDTVLWSLDRLTFVNVVKDSMIKKRNMYEEFIKSVPIFETMEPYELTKILDAVKPVEYKAGETIISEGDEGNVFYLLENGEAYATKQLGTAKKETKVMDYAKGAYFGERALIRDEPRAASVIAKTDCVCLTLDRESFKRLLGPLDEILKRNMAIYNKYSSVD